MRPFYINKSTIELVTKIYNFIRFTLCEALLFTESDVFGATIYANSAVFLAKVSVEHI